MDHIEILSDLKRVLLQQSADQVPDDLGPLMEPGPVSFSFSTPGWYLLEIFLIGILSYSSVMIFRKYKRNTYRRKALKRIDALPSPNAGTPSRIYLNTLLAQLKIVASHTYGRMEVASKYGDEWWSFLESTGKNTPFSDYKNALTDSVYKDVNPDSSTLLEISDLTKRWIKTHA